MPHLTIGPQVAFFVIHFSAVTTVAGYLPIIASPNREGRCTRSGRTTRRYQVAPQQLGSFEVLAVTDQEQARRCVILEDWLSPPGSNAEERRHVLFEDAWDEQKRMMQLQLNRLEKAAADDGSSSPFLKPAKSRMVEEKISEHGDLSSTVELDNVGIDRVIFLEHAPVYTLGTASDPENILSPCRDKVPVVRMDRGGEVTYHGPGQLTVYPVLDLRHYKQDIHWYMRALEEVVVEACRAVGIPGAYRKEDCTGVWVEDHKIAAVGIKCKRWVTQHGLAVNVLPDSLENFEGIVPCGLHGTKVGCINQFLPPQHRGGLSLREFAGSLEVAFEKIFRIRFVRTGRKNALLDEERSLQS